MPLTVPDAPFDPATAETQVMPSDPGASTTRGSHQLPAAHEPSLSEVRAGDGLVPPAASASDRYDPEALLGVGGMGEVLLQFDRRIGRHVALKTIRGGQPSASALVRFLREARVQGQLEHPAIVPVYDLAANDAGEPYFTMKRVHGHTLAGVLEQLASGDAAAAAKFTRRKLLAAYAQVCLAVEYAHQRGVFHRDLKPGNIMLGDFGEVYVLDWGLAKLESEVEPKSQGPSAVHLAHDIPNVTAFGDLLGTPMYMAPEQLRGGEVDARADVFSLGAILFELLTLTPFRRADSVPRLMAEAEEASARASARASDVPPELDDACARALERQAELRTITAGELAHAVERYLEGDRDLAARRALAEQHLVTARAKLSLGGTDPAARVAALREAMRALVLRPEDAATQELLMSLVIDGEGALPAEAEGELAARATERRREAGRLGIYGCLSWLACLPIAMALGVRDWTVPAVLTGLTTLALILAIVLVRGRLSSQGLGVGLACVTAVVVAFASGWLGPFVLVPVTAVSTGIMFIIHSTKAERKPFIGLFVAAVLVPFVLERLHVFSPAYAFTPDGLLLLPRALALPENGTLLALAYTSVSYVVLVLFFVGRMRDSQQDAERRLFVQAFYLQQLFPAAGGDRRAAATPAIGSGK